MSASTYSFRAVDSLGSQVTGAIEAGSEAAVLESLRSRGLTALEVKSNAKSVMNADLQFFQRIKAAELSVMTRQMATMVSSGLSLLQTLHVLEEQTESPKLKTALTAVRQDVEAGRSFSDALAAHPKVFSTVFVAMVHAGETGGFLEDSLERVADQLEADEALRREVKSAMVYPITVICFAMTIMTAMIAFIVPVFAKIFKDQGAELPTLTKITVGASDVLRGYPWAFVLVIVGAVWGFRRWKASEQGRRQWHKLCLRAPMGIGGVVRKVALARWSRTLSALVSSGVPMLEAIDVTGRTAGNAVIEDAMDTVRNRVHSGGTIGAALKDEPVFPAMVAQMVTVGETTGALSNTLSKVADFYEAEVQAAVKSLTSILEPAMIMLVGGIVGFIVLSMYLPMFKVYDAIQ